MAAFMHYWGMNDPKKYRRLQLSDFGAMAKHMTEDLQRQKAAEG